MVKSLSALVAFLCLGPAALPLGPPALAPVAPEAPPAGCAAAASGVAPEGLTHIFFCPAEAVADPGYTVSTVRSAAAAGALLEPRLRGRLEGLIQKLARRHGVDERLVRAVLTQESGGDPRAVSPKGALGLMQLMPETAALMGVSDPFDPEENVAGGVKYLKLCLKRFGDDVTLALAAYNAGPAAVERYCGVPPYRETEDYVGRVLTAYAGTSPLDGRGSPPPRPAAAKKEEPPPPAGLNWRLPTPTWKLAAPKPRLAGPHWKGSPPGRDPGLQAGAIQPSSQESKFRTPLFQGNRGL